MNWIWISALLLAAIVATGVAVKLALRRKLDDIDGCHGTAIQKDEDDNMIGKA